MITKEGEDGKDLYLLNLFSFYLILEYCLVDYNCLMECHRLANVVTLLILLCQYILYKESLLNHKYIEHSFQN